MKDLNVIVFDEAHHAHKDSPMHQLMNQYAEADESDRPRVIGLTGMLLTGNVKPQNVSERLEKLENTFHGTITTVKTYRDHANVLIYSTNPDESIARYESSSDSVIESSVIAIVEKMIKKVSNWPAQTRGNPVKKIKKLLRDFLYQLNDLG